MATSPFTPEQISQILEEFFKVVGTRQYIGARYVPIFGRKGEDSIQWNNSAPYEPLTIVLYQGNSYTSRQYVPEGVEITNEAFWALTGNYNAQVEAYRQEVRSFSDRIDAIETSNQTQTEQLAGTAESGLKTNIDANTAHLTDVDAKLAGTTDSGLRTLITDNAADISENTEAITALTQTVYEHTQQAAQHFFGIDNRLDGLGSDLESISATVTTLGNDLDTLEGDVSKLKALPKPITIEGAKPILRYEVGITENMQGGIYFEQDGGKYYAIARVVSGDIATVVDIFNVDTQAKVGTCNGSFAHGNSMSHADHKLYVGGANGNTIFTEIDCTNVNTPYVANTYDLSNVGESSVWAFGEYDDTHFWYTPNNNAVYLISKELTDKQLLCYAPNPTYMRAVQQGFSYDRASDTFISCKSSYIVLFNSQGKLINGFKFDWHYGYIFTTEVEQASMVDGKIYFHNNNYIALPAGFTDYRRVNAAWVWDPKAPIYTEPFVMPLGARSIKIDNNAPTIPDFDLVAPDVWHYPLDAAAYMIAHPEGGRAYSLETDTPFVCVIPPNVNTINLNKHGVGGVALMNGASVLLTGNVAYSASTPETAMLTTTVSGRKMLAGGRSNLMTFTGSTPEDESVWVYNQYGGAAVGSSGKLAFVTGTGAKIPL